MLYFTKTPGWLKLVYKRGLWSIDSAEKTLYLTFDDGPHPTITPFVLEELRKSGAKGTFFCIGKNVVAYPEVYRRIIEEGHSVGNHTYSHLNGWKTADATYLNDIEEAKKYIDSDLFRPPYGRITAFQYQQLSSSRFQLQTIMWSILSGDFDGKINPSQCLENVLLNVFPGAIIVFHDSEKAFDRLKYVLPAVLQSLTEKAYRFEKIEV